ncbi:MAG: hypothetical protein SO046_08440 [Actinomyces urogenitalis]|uniref:hypothetical protein n=1 Tax=Actinomyces urogenitalis TaxID=103621 RepID=UPI00242D9B6D|nr:hypothetical protein [Actinomyces urogenitalis]MCI7456759.1 hypothetical protein [Actinomyces urogenitalis]MDY3679220.1 hypothetical protein [Actinomyces urogenitalis]
MTEPVTPSVTPPEVPDVSDVEVDHSLAAETEPETPSRPRSWLLIWGIVALVGAVLLAVSLGYLIVAGNDTPTVSSAPAADATPMTGVVTGTI